MSTMSADYLMCEDMGIKGIRTCVGPSPLIFVLNRLESCAYVVMMVKVWPINLDVKQRLQNNGDISNDHAFVPTAYTSSETAKDFF